MEARIAVMCLNSADFAMLMILHGDELALYTSGDKSWSIKSGMPYLLDDCNESNRIFGDRSFKFTVEEKKKKKMLILELLDKLPPKPRLSRKIQKTLKFKRPKKMGATLSLNSPSMRECLSYLI
ncbi:hypothetical protein SAY87_007300 [Trapa incisa]|uniref:Uncharacterized protein n=1 Tax=Trapa incisa TaxID=236973 RepID=A0AAN7Q0P6_9MYRT|nr:hypothetical protein SAY87_007300 [Trapa incisa]